MGVSGRAGRSWSRGAEPRQKRGAGKKPAKVTTLKKMRRGKKGRIAVYDV